MRFLRTFLCWKLFLQKVQVTVMGLVICSYVLIEVFSKLEDLVTESLSDGLGWVICSSVPLDGFSILEVLVTKSARDGNRKQS